MSGRKRARAAGKRRKTENEPKNDANQPGGKPDLPASMAPVLIVLLLLFAAGGCILLRDLHTSLVIGEICHRGCKTWESNWWAMFWETAFLFMLLFFDLCLVYGGIDGLIRMAKGGGRS